MGYWKIVAGHKKDTTGDVRSVILGDWLRHDYVAIGWDKDEGQHNVFRDNVFIGDKIVVVAEGFIWAIGEITSNLETIDLLNDSKLYRHQRKVFWFKVMKLSYKNLPDSVLTTLQDQHAINELSPSQWETIILHVS